MEAGADFGASPCRFARRVLADDGDPFRRKRTLQRARHQPQIGELPILAAMGDHRFGQRRVEDFDRFIVAFARLGHAHADLRHLLRNAGGGADLQPAQGEVIQHADLLDQLPGLVVRQNQPHHPEP